MSRCRECCSSIKLS
ncbi:unnamed protein product [Debaryomyces tyrocola]|nr:unnamed protein product [Debaryomyces tyrocola]